MGPRPTYQRILELGRGGMASAWLTAVRAPSGAVERLVVLKEMRPELAERDDFRRMFFDEAHLAAQLRHPNVVQTYDVVEDPPGVFSMMMEYLDGQPLSRLRTSGRREVLLPLQLRTISDALAGLHYFHELRHADGRPGGLIHRDVSPQNIFVTYDGDAKLLDFGIAKSVDVTSMTEVGVIKGKVTYMAPEQVTGQKLDRRTDIFSMGVVLWEAIAGRRIWAGENEGAIIGRLMTGAIPRLRDAARDVPPELEAICMRALAKEPRERYATAEAFRDELEAFIGRMTLKPSRAELSRLVSSLFGDDRRKVREAIDAAIVGGAPAAISRAPAPTGSVSLPPAVRTTTEARAASMPLIVSAPRRSNAAVAFAIGAAVVVGVVVGVGGMVGAKHLAKPAPSQATTVALAAPAEPALPATSSSTAAVPTSAPLPSSSTSSTSHPTTARAPATAAPPGKRVTKSTQSSSAAPDLGY